LPYFEKINIFFNIITKKVSTAAAAIALKFHPKHVTNKNKTKHIMKISHINVNIYDKTATVNKIVIKMLNKHENCDQSLNVQICKDEH
jgi:hypothetical protein